MVDCVDPTDRLLVSISVQGSKLKPRWDVHLADAGNRAGGSQECIGPRLQDRPAAALHLVLPAGQSSEEIADPLLNRHPAPQTQVARRLFSRPPPDRFVSVEVRAVTRQIHQPRPRYPQIFPYRLATPELVEGAPVRCPKSHSAARGASPSVVPGRRLRFRCCCCPPVPSTPPPRSPGTPPRSSWPSPHTVGYRDVKGPLSF